jgi:hypothetical protein
MQSYHLFVLNGDELQPPKGIFATIAQMKTMPSPTIERSFITPSMVVMDNSKGSF